MRTFSSVKALCGRLSPFDNSIDMIMTDPRPSRFLSAASLLWEILDQSPKNWQDWYMQLPA
ncbi:hypothetical protein L208DRAFT_1414296 [Tricholoma matsutake]|nr:hypothetical protein L208DRAFT_1414296 [Tricholoma matsutake 945]